MATSGLRPIHERLQPSSRRRCCWLCTSLVVVWVAVVIGVLYHVVSAYEWDAYGSPHGVVAPLSKAPFDFCNFDRQVCCRSSVAVQYPRSVQEVQEVVREAVRRGSRVRVAGAGHSMSQLVCDHMDDGAQLTLVSLDRLNRVLRVQRLNRSIDDGDTVDTSSATADLLPSTAHVEVEAGMRLIELNRALRYLGLGLKNMGLIQEQSVAGLMATGVHGTGQQLASVPSMVVSMDVVLANGTLVTWSSTGPSARLFRYARLHLGLFGVVVRATLAVTDAYQLERENRVRELRHVLQELDVNNRRYRHYQFWWIPGTIYALENRMDLAETLADADANRCTVHAPLGETTRSCKFVHTPQRAADGGCDTISTNGIDDDAAMLLRPIPVQALTAVTKYVSMLKTDLLFYVAVQVSKVFPAASPMILGLIPYLEPPMHLIGWAPDILTFPGINFHSVRYTELEYFVPYHRAAEGIAAFVAFAETYGSNGNQQCVLNSIDPIRTVMGDDVPLSPLSGWAAHGGGIALSFVLVQQPGEFNACEGVIESQLLALGGRPHWGKRHGLVSSFEDVKRLYGTADAMGYRQAVLSVDPRGVFWTNTLTRLFDLHQ